MPPISESLTKFGNTFQTKVITCLLIDNEFIQTIYDLLQAEQFDTESKQWLVREIKAYFYEYKVKRNTIIQKGICTVCNGKRAKGTDKRKRELESDICKMNMGEV